MAFVTHAMRQLLVPRKYVGQVATRCQFPDTFFAGNTTWMSSSAHFLRDNVTAVKIAFANSYTAGTAETATGAVTTIKGGIYNAAGVARSLKWSGSTTGTIPNGGILWSDWVQIDGKAGDKISVRNSQANTSGVVYNTNSDTGADANGTFNCQNAALGDANENTATDKTISGTITDAAAGFWIGPCAIVGMTNKPTFGIIGDSVAAGIKDTQDSSGDIGSIARSIGPLFGYMNFGKSGDKASTFATAANSTQRRLVLLYCSHIICALGLNDILASGDAAATVEGNVQTIAKMFWPKPVYHTTLTPVSTGTFTSSGAQTTDASNSRRVTFNQWARAGVPEMTGMLDINTAVENSLDDGKWVSPGGVAQTPDGIHTNQTGSLRIVSQGVIDNNRFNFNSGAISYLPRV